MPRTIATNTKVELDGLLEFVRPRHHMLLMTTRADGTVQASPVSGGVDTEGRIVISSYPERAKSTNVKRSGKAGVVVLSDEWNGAWVQVDGSGEVIELPEAVDALVDYYRSISGEHPDWDEYREAMRTDKRCLIRIQITRAGPDRQG